MRRREIEDLTFIDCFGVPPGFFGTEEDMGRSIAHVRYEYGRGIYLGVALLIRYEGR